MPWVRNNDGDWVWEEPPAPPEPPPSGDIWPQPGPTGGYGGATYPQPPQAPQGTWPQLYNAITQAWAATNPYGAFAGLGAGGGNPSNNYYTGASNAAATEPGGGGGRQRFNRWDQAYNDETRPQGPNNGYVFPPSSDTTGTGTTTRKDDTGGGGGGGGGGGAPDPYAWMAKFGGKDFVKLFLKKPGETLANYYSRMGGDPVKTLIAKYQELEGMDPDMNMRAMAIGALGLTGIIDPTTLEEVFSMPQSDYLSNLMKAGPTQAGLTRFKTPQAGNAGGLRTLKGNDWWSMGNALKTWAPVEAAKPPTIAPV